MNFSEKLQTLRKANGMSQENLADEVGVSRQAVSKWELGASLPDMDKLIAISDLFAVSIDALVKDDVSDTGSTGQTSAGVQQVQRVYFFRPEYEYKSAKTLFGLPLLHINIGHGLKKAKGIIAIGTIAVGFISIGMLSLGILSIGVLAAGLISLGALVFGLLLAGGAVAVGTVAAGGVAIGLVALGGLAIGMFSFGGYATASHVAVGGFARAHIAIGDIVDGVKTIHIPNDDIRSVSQLQVKTLINQEYPNLWKPITGFITSLFSS